MTQPQPATPHAERAHATWSASSTARNWNCSGALALSAQVEDLDIESEAAGWGTACHELSEKCLRTGLDAADSIGATIKTKSHEFDVDEEMAECAQVYIDYVRQQQNYSNDGKPRANDLWVEERFSLEKLKPPFDAGGTCDAIVYSAKDQTLEVIDLKGGRGIVVEVNDNKQLRTYALGAILAHPGLRVDKVTATIVQPRAHHKDGRIRSETFHVADLMEWTSDLVAKMNLSAEAIAEYAKVTGALTLEAWAEKYLKAGSHCTFCPAEGFCPALKSKALAVADAWFDDAGAMQIKNQPDVLDPAALAAALDGADLLQNWLNAVRALATRLAEGGTEIPRYHLADKFGRRKFKDPDAVPAALDLLGVPEDKLFEKKLRSPAQIETALGAKGLKPIKAQFDALYHTPLTGRTLVSSAKSSKPAATPKAEAFFTAS